jgi:hypothetical protein
MVCSLLAQCAVAWTQRQYIRDGYFDFVLYYSAGKILNDGKGTKLYDLTVQRDYQKEFHVGYKDIDVPFNHLPYELLPMLILAKFSFPVAHLLWTAINLLLIAMILVRLNPFVERSHRILFILTLLAYFPTIMALKMGQDSVITTLLLVETFASLKRKRYSTAGSLLALGLYKPHFVLPLLGIFLWHRRWSSIIAFISTGLLLGAISLTMVGWDGLLGLLSLWLPMTQRGHVVWPELMMNWRGLAYITLHLGGLTAATNVLTLALSLVTFGITLRLWPRSAAEHDELFNLRFALAVTMTALVSFHLYSYDGMLLVIPFIIMLDCILKRSSPYAARHQIFLGLLILSYIPLMPNALLSGFMLAWWAIPLPIFFALIALEIWSRSGCQPEPARIQAPGALVDIPAGH